MDDKTMLEWAARAAGISLDYRRGSDAYYYDDPETGREEWNPPEDNGQALWLAVKLGMSVWRDDDIIWCAGAGSPAGDDPYAATRRAITRAAAEIGKAMGRG